MFRLRPTTGRSVLDARRETFLCEHGGIVDTGTNMVPILSVESFPAHASFPTISRAKQIVT